MPNSREENIHSQPLANAVEVLGNVLYLVEHSVDEPDSIRTLLKLAEPAMDTLRKAAWGMPEQGVAGDPRPEHDRFPPNGQDGQPAERQG
jgi:hypothetical protein